MRTNHRLRSILFVAALCPGLSSIAHADVLLVGDVLAEGDNRVPFSLSGNSREDVVGGTIVLGDAEYEITHVSVHNLIGSQREYQGKTEYVIFSSSFSPVTASGKPWVASEKYTACDEQYNSFLARYLVGAAQDSLPEVPFKQLAESLEDSESSAVFCFVSKPEDR